MLAARAIVVPRAGGIEVLELGSRDIPLPGPSQVRVRVHAAGVNPVDTYIRAGANNYSPQYPYTPGSDFAGTIEALGPGVTSFSLHQRVFGSLALTGSYATHALADASCVFPLPDALSFAQGCAVPVPYCTAYRALVLKANVRPGETVLVHGASGGVGVAAVQMALDLGCEVVGTAGSDDGLALVRRLGARAVNHRREGYEKEVGAADVIVEMIANVNLSRDLKMLRAGGRVLVVGSRGEVTVNPREVMAVEGSVIGVMLRAATPREEKETWAYVLNGLRRGGWEPVVDREFDMLGGETGAAHDYVINKTATKGKVTLRVD